MNGLSKLGQPDCGAEMALTPMTEDRGIKPNLIRKRDRLRSELAKVEAAIEALNKQPEVAELLETIIKVM